MGKETSRKSDKYSSKNKEKKSKKHKKHKKRSSSSSSSGSSEIEWVEKGEQDKNKSLSSHPSKEPSTSSNLQRDDWMSATSFIPCVTREQLRAAKGPTKKQLEAEERKQMLDCPGQTGRELNPYWANGGTGLPPEAPGKSEEPASSSSSSAPVGNSGWYKKALLRAKEQALEEGRPLEEVASERWGSLDKLLSLIDEAEKQESSKNEGRRRYDKDDKRYGRDEKRYDRHDKGYRLSDGVDKRYNKDEKRNDREERRYDRGGRFENEQRQFGSDRKESPPRFRDRRYSPQRFRKPNLDEEERRDGKQYNNPPPSKPRFQRPSDADEPSAGTSYRNPPSGSGSWRKKDSVKTEKPVEPKPQVTDDKPIKRATSPLPPPSSESDSEPEVQEQPQLLSDAQLNELAAKLVKAEILGNDSLASELKQKLEVAREARKAEPAAAAAVDKNNSKEEVVVLSRTDSKGFSRPLQTKGAVAEPYGGRRRKQKVDTHSADGQRARYFPDDDKYSLQEMFRKEKTTTVEDDRAMFAKLAGKDKRQEHDLDMDDIFAERARESASDGKLEAKERDRAIWEHKRMSKILDNCQWCFDNKSSLKNLVIAIGSVSYVCLPAHQSLTEGHCLVAPVRHVPCATQLDEDVWQEMQDFRKALVKMFADRGDDCIWFESAMYLHKQPHMVWHCVPVPRESGDLAPIYFKKAILECETEWSTNKKLVDLGGRDVRKAVPKGLPYFAVDFGMQSGFAHVIEDEKEFPNNFAQEIIGGMLELDHNVWRKPRRESFEFLTKKVTAFIKEWTPYDITKKGKKRKKERSPSQSSSNSD